MERRSTALGLLPLLPPKPAVLPLQYCLPEPEVFSRRRAKALPDGLPSTEDGWRFQPRAIWPSSGGLK
jgi:hypothetical protein